MKNICTVSDINYLSKGLALYDSISNNFPNFILNYLCIDDLTYEKLNYLNLPNLKVFHVDEFTSKDIVLLDLKNNDYRYFCWSLASYFSNYLLNTNIDSITYIDSDIFFHHSLEILFDSFGDKNEIGIFRHRQFDLSTPYHDGWFNVGVVYFKNGKIGRHICNWWSDAVLYKKYENLSTCGDQKYLDEFPNMCPEDYIYIDGDIGHGAPWQWQLYDFSDYEENGNIIWNGNKQKLIFTHFSQFKYEENGYVPSTTHYIYTPLNLYSENTSLKKIHKNYYHDLKKVIQKYNL